MSKEPSKALRSTPGHMTPCLSAGESATGTKGGTLVCEACEVTYFGNILFGWEAASTVDRAG
jgi:hypothetical protein